MAKVISTLFISADGVAEIDPDWHFPYFDENMGRAVGEDYDTSDVLLIGRETYDSFAGAWPDREAAGGDDAPFAKQLGDMRKVVVSRQPLEFSWRNSELIKGDLVEAVTALKADAGIKGILIPGSISVVQQLLAAGLVDELRLLVHPVAARKGRKLFDDGDAPYHLRVTATEAFPTGVIRVIYSPTEAPAKVGYDEVKDQVPEIIVAAFARRIAICRHGPHVPAARPGQPDQLGQADGRAGQPRRRWSRDRRYRVSDLRWFPRGAGDTLPYPTRPASCDDTRARRHPRRDRRRVRRMRADRFGWQPAVDRCTSSATATARTNRTCGHCGRGSPGPAANSSWTRTATASMIIATVMDLLHFRGKNQQVQVTCVDLGERLAGEGRCEYCVGRSWVQDPAGGKQVLDVFAAAHCPYQGISSQIWVRCPLSDWANQDQVWRLLDQVNIDTSGSLRDAPHGLRSP